MSKMKRAAERDDGAGDIRPNDRRQRIAEFVARFERLLKERAELDEDLKALAGEAKGQFGKRLPKAMRKIAKLRLDDKRDAARAELEALQEVGDACRFDLFDWSRAGGKSGAGGSPQSTDKAAPPGLGSPPVTH